MRNFYIGSLKIHDITVSAETVGYHLITPIKGLEFPDVRYSSQDKPAEHGSIDLAQLYGGRTVTLTGKILGDDIITYNTNRRALQAALRIVKNNYISQSFIAKFLNDAGMSLQFYAKVYQKPDIPEEFLNHGGFFITLRAADPYLYDQTPQSVNLPIGSGSVTNNGDGNSAPILTFNGPLHHPLLKQTDLTEQFQLNVDIAGGHVVVVDTAKKTIILDGITNYNAYFDNGNTWLSWIPGVNNLELDTTSGGDTGSVDIDFSDSWIGH